MIMRTMSGTLAEIVADGPAINRDIFHIPALSASITCKENKYYLTLNNKELGVFVDSFEQALILLLAAKNGLGAEDARAACKLLNVKV